MTKRNTHIDTQTTVGGASVAARVLRELTGSSSGASSSYARSSNATGGSTSGGRSAALGAVGFIPSAPRTGAEGTQAAVAASSLTTADTQNLNYKMEVMSGMERAQHVYTAVTAIEHIVEIARHVVSGDVCLDALHKEQHMAVRGFFADVVATLPTLQGVYTDTETHLKKATHRGSKVTTRALTEAATAVAKKGAAAAAPTAAAKRPEVNTHRLRAAKELLESVRRTAATIGYDLEAEGVTPQQQHKTAKHAPKVAYPGVTGQLLSRMTIALEDMILLLSSSPSTLASRVASCTKHIERQTAHYIEDFNALHEDFLPNFFAECRREGAGFFSARLGERGLAALLGENGDGLTAEAANAVALAGLGVASRGGATSGAATAAQLHHQRDPGAAAEDRGESSYVSLVPLDFRVGVRAGAPIRALLHNATIIFKRAMDRVTEEEATLKAVAEQRAVAKGDAKATAIDTHGDAATAAVVGRTDGRTRELRDEQISVISGIKAVVEAARKDLHELETYWNQQELKFAHAALQGDNVSGLVSAKHIRAAEMSESILKLHERVESAALPFLSPQYCRRRSLTYASPACMRLGVRLIAPSQVGRVIEVTNFHTDAAASIIAAAKATPGAAGVLPEELFPTQGEVWVSFDTFPELVKGNGCLLRHANSESAAHAQRVHAAALDEERECGGYFVCGGNERILRMLQMQRCNVPINIERSLFAAQGPGFSPRGVVYRSKRPSGLTCVNFFYSNTSGEIVFSFARRNVWHVPVSALLLACKAIGPTELLHDLTIGVTDDTMRARAEAMLQHHMTKPYCHLDHPLKYLALIGRMFRDYQQHRTAKISFIPEAAESPSGLAPHHDAWYGLFMLRRHVLPHLNCAAATPDAIRTSDVITAAGAGAGKKSAAEINELVGNGWPGPEIVAELSAKYDALIEIVRQVHGFVGGHSVHQGNDSPAFQEVFTPGQLLVAAVETSTMRALKIWVHRLATSLPASIVSALLKPTGAAEQLHKLQKFVLEATQKSGVKSDGLLSTVQKLMVTGNYNADKQEDFFMPQTTGWSVMVEHLNFFRFFEQLRTMHRGKKIADMRSSDVRKYPSDAFGFVCMVHSPDGEDCGVVNYMTQSAQLTRAATAEERQQIVDYFHTRVPGFAPVAQTGMRVAGAGPSGVVVPVWVEGRVIGFAPLESARVAATELRNGKLQRVGPDSMDFLPAHGKLGVEVVLSAPEDRAVIDATTTVEVAQRQPQGLHIFTGCGRLMRPIWDLVTGSTVYVGAWEQMWLDIAGVPSDMTDAARDLRRKFGFAEVNGEQIISMTSNTIPFFEHNCSPRNLFQCGLSKQSSGTQLQATSWRKEAKLFRTLCPQRYIVRTQAMNRLGLDDFSLGVNAVVAVLSYTGYDMDDAVIINRSAIERGMLTAHITVSKVIPHDLHHESAANGTLVFFNLKDGGERASRTLLPNGLPPRRAPLDALVENNERGLPWDNSVPPLRGDDAVYCTARRFEYVDPTTQEKHYRYTKHKVVTWADLDKGEHGWVHNVVPLKYDGPDVVQVLFVFRIPRAPTVGDKFASRHGQKGTLPLLIPATDLPFTSRGMTPDVIINPHAFPSRMTVGMILEMMAGKIGAVQGRWMDNSAWSLVDEKPLAADRLRVGLVDCGFEPHGREQLYCGATGVAMEAEVFIGIGGYQRLRHMVLDKWQARARTDHGHRAVTRTGQPVKGRKRHGGVRVGEMERDALLSHGIAEVVVDRLMNVSDLTRAFICMTCGGFAGVYERAVSDVSTVKHCRFCEQHGTSVGMHEDGAAAGPSAALVAAGAADNVRLIHIPQVLRLWASELTSVGVRVAFRFSEEPIGIRSSR